MSEWRTIDTAPMNGTPCLLGSNDEYDVDEIWDCGPVWVGHWSIQRKCWTLVPRVIEWFMENKMSDEELSRLIDLDDESAPSHWQPLPEPPNE